MAARCGEVGRRSPSVTRIEPNALRRRPDDGRRAARSFAQPSVARSELLEAGLQGAVARGDVAVDVQSGRSCIRGEPPALRPSDESRHRRGRRSSRTGRRSRPGRPAPRLQRGRPGPSQAMPAPPSGRSWNSGHASFTPPVCGPHPAYERCVDVGSSAVDASSGNSRNPRHLPRVLEQDCDCARTTDRPGSRARGHP